MKDSTSDLTKRRAQALGAFWKMKTLWDDDTVPIELKIKIFKVSVLSIFLYGCETWVITESEKQQVNSLATKCYRYMLHINQEQEHITNEELYNILNEKPLMVEMKKRQLKKLGHFIRKPPESLVNKYALYIPTHGHRPQGRPKTSYTEYISKTINPQIPPTENEIRLTAADRKEWKKVIDEALTQ